MPGNAGQTCKRAREALKDLAFAVLDHGVPDARPRFSVLGQHLRLVGIHSNSAKSNLVDSMILDKADRLRLVRNLFVHLKSFEHEHNLGNRSVRLGAHPKRILEQDANDAIIALYAVAVYAFGRS